MTDHETPPTEAIFALKKGENESHRLVEFCLQQIAQHINASPNLKALGDPYERDGEWHLTFDVKTPGMGFDHIEFTIKQTGWGRGV